jgi:hypothetical protein
MKPKKGNKLISLSAEVAVDIYTHIYTLIFRNLDHAVNIALQVETF